MTTPEEFRISLAVNGQEQVVYAEPRMTLLDLLRDKLQLTGTNTGCEQGVCGTCTVLVDGQAVRSCLMFGVQAEGASLTTIEGVAGSNEQMHPIQQAFQDNHGLQCGYCTPGMVLKSIELLNENANPDRDDVREAIHGNLCRCTGYQFIVDSVMDAAERLRNEQGAEDANRVGGGAS